MNQSNECRLQNINKFITLNKPDRSSNAQNFSALKTHIIRKMKETDPSFKHFFADVIFAGSYADNLKISKPDEYDLNIHLKIPQADVHLDRNRSGYVKINLKKSIEYYNKLKNVDIVKYLTRVTDNQGYILLAQFQSWLEGIFVKAGFKRCQVKLNETNFDLNYGKTGPAHTIYARGGPINFSVDFVFAIVFEKDKWLAKRPLPSNSKGKWSAVPKPLRGSGNLENISFIASYVEPETRIIEGKQNLKNTLRMIKKIRDNRNVNNFKSYFIKTVYLLACDEEIKEFWNKPASEVLSLMLLRLIRYLEAGNLPFYWDRKFNMLGKFTESQIKNMCGQFKSAHKDFELFKNGDIERIFSIFLTEDERRKILIR